MEATGEAPWPAPMPSSAPLPRPKQHSDLLLSVSLFLFSFLVAAPSLKKKQRKTTVSSLTSFFLCCHGYYIRPRWQQQWYSMAFGCIMGRTLKLEETLFLSYSDWPFILKSIRLLRYLYPIDRRLSASQTGGRCHYPYRGSSQIRGFLVRQVRPPGLDMTTDSPPTLHRYIDLLFLLLHYHHHHHHHNYHLHVS